MNTRNSAIAHARTIRASDDKLVDQLHFLGSGDDVMVVVGMVGMMGSM